MPGAVRFLPIAVLVLGCRGRTNMFAAAGPQSERLRGLLIAYLAVLLVVFAVVLAVLALAIIRGRAKGRGLEPIVDPPRTAAQAPLARPIDEPSPARERALFVSVAGAVALTAVILFALLVASYRTGKAVAAHGSGHSMVVEVTGHQWWWEFRYLDPLASQIVTDANELHIPVGRQVELSLRSADVIHSFWVPRLHGKRDLIPGDPATLVIQADAPGEYPGTCAEFCGLQHAHMSFTVIAHPEEEFRAWKASALQAAPAPTTDEQKRGQKVFLSSTCVMCHTISGTPAQAKTGPDLSHVGSRKTLAAGFLPNSRGHLAGWISDPTGIKPGVRMPPSPLPPDDLRALLAYLESLQ